jgi:hypothetical protein
MDRMAAARAARAAKKAAEPATEAPHPESAPHVVSVSKLEQPLEIPAGPTSHEKAAANAETKRLDKIAALRAAKLANSDPQDEPKVQARVLKKGHGQIAMGEHIGGLGDLTYDFGETAELPQSIAAELEDRGFVEIQ